MAPEYALGRRCDARTDLFSLGVLLYECLAGRRPFDADNDIETLDRARRGEHEALATMAPEAPSALVSAIEALLEPDAEHRPPNAGALLDQLAGAPPPPLARRDLGKLVHLAGQRNSMLVAPGLASTRPAATPRLRKRLPSRK